MSFPSQPLKTTKVTPQRTQEKPKIPLFDEIHNIIQTFYQKHGYSYQREMSLQFKSTDEMFNTGFFNDLIRSSIGLQAIAYAIKYGLTFVIPFQQSDVSPEFLASHMIIRQSGKKNFVTINKTYGMIEPHGLSHYADQMIPFPSFVDLSVAEKT